MNHDEFCYSCDCCSRCVLLFPRVLQQCHIIARFPRCVAHFRRQFFVLHMVLSFFQLSRYFNLSHRVRSPPLGVRRCLGPDGNIRVDFRAQGASSSQAGVFNKSKTAQHKYVTTIKNAKLIPITVVMADAVGAAGAFLFFEPLDSA